MMSLAKIDSRFVRAGFAFAISAAAVRRYRDENCRAPTLGGDARVGTNCGLNRCPGGL
jgi:hypothetical protein